jgi:hypothetical protein
MYTGKKQLIELYTRIYFVDEAGTANVANGAAKNTQRSGENAHIAEIEERLEEPVHFCLEEEIVDCVEVNVNRNRSACRKTAPAPKMPRSFSISTPK